MPLTPSPNPVLASELVKLTGASVGHPDTWNPIHQALLDNDTVINAAVIANKQAADQAAAQLDQRVGAVEATSSVSVQKAVSLDWTYRNNAINFELFTPGYTLIDVASIAVVQGVAGDDSLDVADTSALKVGDYYVLTDPTAVDAQGGPAPFSELVQVVSILTPARIRLAANLKKAWGGAAVLSRSSLTILGASNAKADVGDIYLSKTINIGTDADGGAVVIRRQLNTGEIRLYYRDSYHAAWTECGWSYRRTGGTVPVNFADYEYVLPMRGDGNLRADVVGEPMTIAHIVALGSTTGLGGFLNPALRPNTPVMSSPLDGAVGIMERPTLALAAYSSPTNIAQAAVRFKLSKTADMAVLLHESGELASGLSYQIPAGVLPISTKFYVVGSVKDVSGQWSDWSLPISFTTAASYAYVAAPTMTAPASNALDVSATPTLSTSAFTMVGGTADTHAASRFRIRTATGTYAVPLWDSGRDTVNKLSIVVPANVLSSNESVYYAQAQHEGTAKGVSEWSPEVKFTTKKSFANIIGLALLNSGGATGTWARVDENGAARAADAAYFGSHPVFGGIQDQIVDGQYMVKIPAFYVKRGVIAAGAYAGKKAVWVSDQPTVGYSLHPAFKNAGGDMAQFWVGKYQGTQDGSTKLGSKPGVAPLTLLDMATMRARAEARNNSGVTGFSLWSIYQLSAIQTLALIEMGGSDSQSLIGIGNIHSSGPLPVDDPIVAQATWRGIVGLWGNVCQYVDGVQLDGSSRVVIWDRNGNKSYQTTTRILAPTPTNPTMPRWATSTADDVGVSYDLSDTFIPGSADASWSNATYADAYYAASSTVMNFGGWWGSATEAGLFSFDLQYSPAVAGSNLGARLSKV
jgi:hypothetical protein